MVKDERAKVMLDPSLLLVERSLSDVANNLNRLSEYFSFHVSNHFYNILHEGKPDSASIDYFRYTSKLGNIDRLKWFLEENREYILRYKMPDWASSEYKDAYGAISLSLSAKYRYDKDLCNVIFEELYFLATQSWLVARTKRLFNMFIRGGAASLEYGEMIFDNAVRRTIQMPLTEIVERAHRLRAIGKWSAMAAPVATIPLPINMQIIVGIGSLIANFILIDP